MLGGRVGGCHPALLSPSRGADACCCPSNRQAKSLPSCVPHFLRSMPLNLSVSRPWTHLAPQVSCVLSLAMDWDSKLQILKDWLGTDLVLSSHRESNSLLLALPCPRGAVPGPAVQVPGVYDEAQETAETTLSTLCACLCVLWLNWLMGTSQVFCPRRGNILSSKCPQGGRTFPV